MPAETPPDDNPQPEFTGLNPSDFRAPLPYEQSAAEQPAATTEPPTAEIRIPVQEAPADTAEPPVAPEAVVAPTAVAPEVPAAPADPVAEAPDPTEPEPSPPEPEVETPPAPDESPEVSPEPVPPPEGDLTTAELNEENNSFYTRMPEKAKRLAGRIYDGLLTTVGAHPVVAKLEISYNQFWINRHQETAADLKGQMDYLDRRSEALDLSKSELESVIESLRQQNLPGAEALQLKVQGIEQRKSSLLNDKDSLQSKFEAVDNKTKLYTESRDAVTDRLIGSYDEQLKPIETELSALETARDEAELAIAVAEVQQKEKLAQLDEIEAKRTQVESGLRKSGMSEKDIAKFAASEELEEILADGRKRIASERQKLGDKKAEINAKIAAADAKANPYRDKREQFIRVKKNRPVEMNVPERQRQENPDFAVGTQAHVRVSRENPPGGTETAAGGGAPEEAKTADKRPNVSEHLTKFNDLLKDKYGEDAQIIDTKDFIAATKLRENFQLDTEDFKNILTKYIKFKKLSSDQFKDSLSEL